MSAFLILFANNLLPIFLVTGTGYVLGKFLKIEARTLSRIVFYIFSPALVFQLLTQSQVNEGDVLQMVVFATTHTALFGGLIWLIVRGFKFKRQQFAAVMLTSLFPNAGNFGLSVNLFAFGEIGLAHASLYFVANSILANTAGVFIASLGKSSYQESLVRLFKIPTVYAVALGLIFVGMGWHLPLPLERTISTLAGAAIPGMLVLLGLHLREAIWTGGMSGLVLTNVLRLLVSPALALGLSSLFGLQGAARQAGVSEASMPTAVMMTVLATEFDVKPTFVTAVVFSTTLLSPLTLIPLLAYLGG